MIMHILGRRMNNRAVSQVIAALLLIAIAVAAAVLLYVFSIGLLGSLASSGGQQTKQQLKLESYNWGTLGTPAMTMRNVGSAGINIAGADWFINGVAEIVTVGSCSTGSTGSSLLPQGSCAVTLTTTGLTPSSGVAYTIKVVTPDGAVFSYAAIAGQAS